MTEQWVPQIVLNKLLVVFAILYYTYRYTIRNKEFCRDFRRPGMDLKTVQQIIFIMVETQKCLNFEFLYFHYGFSLLNQPFPFPSLPLEYCMTRASFVSASL